MALQSSPHPRRVIPRRSSATQAHQAFAFSAPLLGLDTAQPLPGGNPNTAVRLENLIPRIAGLQMRKGYRRWVSNLGANVLSFMTYQPAATAHPPQLFAANADGEIFDVTAAIPSTNPPPTPVFTVVGGQPSGEWTSLNFVTSAGVHVMVMVNPGTGYYIYDGTAFTEITMGAGPNQIAGVDPNSFVHVTVYKNRLWFVEGFSTKAWYLPIGQYAGTANFIDFGAMLPMGGALDVIINWTMDGSSGVGINSQIVFVSTQGDILVYAGDDPSTAATFQVVGRWYVGRVPVGRRYFSMFLSDVIILSERGMCFLSELMRGDGFFQNVTTARSINSTLAPLIAASLDTRYWEVKFIPFEQLIIINFAEINVENLQFAFEVNNRAFCTLRGIPMNTVTVFDGNTFTGDLSGNVWMAFSGDSDGVVDDVPGADLQGIVVTAFQPMGEGIRVKRFFMVRPSFLAAAAPGVQAALNSEWNLTAPGNAPAYLGAGANFWDVGQWDVAVWSGGAQSWESWAGATGTGRYAALAMRVRGGPDTTFVAWQALVEAGGIL